MIFFEKYKWTVLPHLMNMINFLDNPLNFCLAGILEEEKFGRENVYKLINRNLLEYISLRERNALLFLIKYISKVVDDSGLTLVFDEFSNNKIHRLMTI